DPAPKVVKDVKPSYPAELATSGLSADVTVRIVIDPTGAVTSASVSSWSVRSPNDGIEAAASDAKPFLDAAKAAALQWKFEPRRASASVKIAFTFTMRTDAERDAIASKDVASSVRGGVAGGVVGGIAGGISHGVAGGIVGGVKPTVVRVGGAIRAP